MKKISGKIAMILILVLLAGMFTSCFTAWAIDVVVNRRPEAIIAILLFPLWPALDIILWPFELAWWLQGGGRGVYEDDGAFITALIDSLPETERASALEKVNSVPEGQFAAMVKVMRALSELPQADRVLLIESIRSLPEEEQAFLRETANSLTDVDIAALADEFSSIPAEEMARQVGVLRETPTSDWGYREYAAERFAAR